MSALQTPMYKLREKFKTIMEGYIQNCFCNTAILHLQPFAEAVRQIGEDAVVSAGNFSRHTPHFEYTVNYSKSLLRQTAAESQQHRLTLF